MWGDATFQSFLDDEYGDASYYAESCISRGMDVRKMADEDIEVWFEHVIECITILLMKFLSMQDKKNGQKLEFGNSFKRNIYNNLKYVGREEWENIGKKLNDLYDTRNSFKYKYNLRGDRKKMIAYHKKYAGFVIREIALERKDDFVEVHVESLINIKKAHPNYKSPNYKREKEV